MFRLITKHPTTGEQKIYNYDNRTGIVAYEDSVITPSNAKPPKFRVSEATPIVGKRRLNRIKIQMGLKCNYSCQYCLQKDIVYDETHSLSAVKDFLAKVPSWFDGGPWGDGGGVSVETWGGEPFVYWKTMQPLVEGLHEMYPNLRFSVITNGSLLSKEKIDWMVKHNFGMSISHDGPYQAVRGDDPLEDPEMLEVWKYALLKLKGRMSINPILSSKDASRKEISDWFALRLGTGLTHGEGSFVNAHNEDSTGIIEDLTVVDYQEFAKKSWHEIRQYGLNEWSIVSMKVNAITRAAQQKSDIIVTNSKCGMDTPSSIAVDLQGNVLTCQNTSAQDISSNGQSHKIGTVDNLEGVRLNTSTHFSYRTKCMECPVLQLCHGNCMMVHGDMFDSGCMANYFDAMPMFAVGVEKLTGHLLMGIESDYPLPNSRKDPFGLMGMDVSEEIKPKKKIIPIKASNGSTKLCGLS